MKPRRFIVCSDIHGDMQDPVAVKALQAFTKDYNPEIRVIAGDLWDFGARASANIMNGFKSKAGT